MRIYIATPDKNLLPLAVLPHETIDQVKDKIAVALNIPRESQHLTFAGWYLLGAQTLSEVNIQHHH